MARKRDTRKEYRDRDARARKEGWTSYGVKRGARSKIKTEIRRRVSLGQALPSDITDLESKVRQVLEQAAKEIKSKDGVMSAKTRTALHAMYPGTKENPMQDYMPVVRPLALLYPRGKRGR